MKKLTLLLTLLSFLTYEALISQVEPRTPEGPKQNKNYKFNDNEKGTSMMPIMGDALPVIKYIEDTLNVEIVRIEYDLLFSTKDSYRTLYKGWKYGIFAIGDYRIKKISIEIYKKVGTEWRYVSTTSKDKYTALSIIDQKDKNEDYAFRVKVEEFEEGYKAGHYALIVYH